ARVLGLFFRYAAATAVIALAIFGNLAVGIAQPQSIFANFDNYSSIYFGTCQSGQGGGCNRFTEVEAADLSANGSAVVGTDFSNDPQSAFGFGGPHAVVWLPNFDSGNGPHQVVPLPITGQDIFSQAEVPADFSANDVSFYATFGYDIDAAGHNAVG